MFLLLVLKSRSRMSSHTTFPSSKEKASKTIIIDSELRNEEVNEIATQTHQIVMSAVEGYPLQSCSW